MRYQICVLIIMRISIFVTMSEETYNPNDDVNVQCPYSGICNKNASRQLPGNNLTPCCSSCSCSPECGLHMNCCYENLDKYRLADSNQMVCVNIGSTDVYISKEYYMIDKCLNGRHDVNSHEQCRKPDNQLKLTNDQAPVSSLDTRFIYFNAECAKCNNVHQFTTWDYTLECRGTLVSFPDPALPYYIANDECSVIYTEPDSEDWSDRRCYTLEPSTCDTADSGLSDMCTSLNLPYFFIDMQGTTIYRNVYCAMCDRLTGLRDICILHEKTGTNAFSTVISGSASLDQLVSQLMQKHTLGLPQTNDGGCLPNEVIHPFQNNCRYIYCPNGMYRTDNGCDYYVASFVMPFYMVQVELKPYPDTKLMTSTLKLLKLKDHNNPKRWIRSSCKANINRLEVFSRVAEDSDTSGTVDILILRLFGFTKRGFDPSVVIPFLKNCIGDKWLLKIDGTMYPFSAELYKYSAFIQDGISSRRSLTTIENILPKLYESISRGPVFINQIRFLHHDLVLSKLYFCEQVRLNMSEVEVGYDEIRILSHDLVLGSNHYEKLVPLNENQFAAGVSESMYNLTTFAVCLEDFNKQAWNERQQVHNNSKMLGQDVCLYMYSMTVLLWIYRI